MNKKKRKAALKKKRNLRRKRGVFVPFSLANSSRNYQGRNNKHEFKTNIHNLSFNKTTFQNVKYSNSNITNCKFKETKFIGVDFVGTNLKSSNFRNASFKNVIFYNPNLNNTNFRDAKFDNCFFINTNFRNVKNLSLNQVGINVLNDNLEKFIVSKDLENSIKAVVSTNNIRKHFVLTTKRTKGRNINKVIIQILLRDFSEDELIRGFNKILNNRRKNDSRFYITYHSYLTFMMKYFKKDVIINSSGPGTSREMKA